MKYDSLIFDLDGTLWNSSKGILEAWRRVLQGHQEIEKEITADMLAACFGQTVDRIAAVYFPELPLEQSLALMEECGRVENQVLSEIGGELYPGVIQTLEILSRQIPLFIVSNCQAGYIESFLTGNHTAVYFKDHECIGVTGLSKGENIRLIIERNGLKNPAYIGDTQSDADAAAAAGIPFIYASYGFGSVKCYDHILTAFAGLEALVCGEI